MKTRAKIATSSQRDIINLESYSTVKAHEELFRLDPTADQKRCRDPLSNNRWSSESLV